MKPGATAEASPTALDPGDVEDETQFPLFHPLVTQLVDADPRVRGVACWSLGQLAYRPSLRLVGRLMRRDPDVMVRVQAAQCIARLGGAGATQVLIQGLKDEDDLVQEVCVLELRRIADPQAIYPLEDFARRLGDGPLAARAEAAVEALKAAEEPGQRPDRRRGGVSKKIRRYLEAIHDKPRDGIAHNNLAVAYFHAAEFDLALRHCRLAKGLGARVQWLWTELVAAGHDPGKGKLSPADQAFLDDPEAGIQPKEGPPAGSGLQLTPEPQRTDLARRSARTEYQPQRSGGRGERSERRDRGERDDRSSKEEKAVRAYRISDHREVAGPPPEAEEKQEERRGGQGDRRQGRRRGRDRRRRKKT